MATSNGMSVDETCSELEKNIIRQIEYYFGNFNLRRDKFLTQLTSVDDGWVPLEKLFTFNRLKSLTTDSAVAVAALRKSKAGLIEVHEDETKIRRSNNTPLPLYDDDDKRKEDIIRRSVFVKGFPVETSLDDILNYFKEHGDIEHVQRRYYTENLKNTDRFKGSVFVCFRTSEAAKEFQKQEGSKYKDNELQLEMKDDYIARKKKERSEKKTETRKAIVKGIKEATEDANEPTKPEYSVGCILRLKNLDGTFMREDIKAVLEKYADIQWIDYKKGEKEAKIRFKEPKAQEVLDKIKESNDGKLEIKGNEVEPEIIQGDEELQYWEEFAKAKAKASSKLWKQGRKAGARGRGHKFKGYRQRTGDESKSKRQKTE